VGVCCVVDCLLEVRTAPQPLSPPQQPAAVLPKHPQHHRLKPHPTSAFFSWKSCRHMAVLISLSVSTICAPVGSSTPLFQLMPLALMVWLHGGAHGCVGRALYKSWPCCCWWCCCCCCFQASHPAGMLKPFAHHTTQPDPNQNATHSTSR